MTKQLDLLYRSGLYASALFLAFMAFIILAQVIGRFFGLIVPSAGELAGYSMAASTFLALADVLRSGQHIRVQMIVERLPPPARRPLELWVLAASGGALAYFGWYSCEMAWDALVYGEMSPGLLPIPLWIPQAGMAIGLVMMALACFEDLLRVLRGRQPSYLDQPGARSE